MERPGHTDLVQATYIAVAISAGIINALQLAMIGGVAREWGSFEATFVSMLASVGGLAILMGGMLLAGRPLMLPDVFRSPWVYAVLAGLAFGLLLAAAQGLPQHYMLTGLTAIPYLLAAAFVGPRLGLGVYFAAIITGQMVGSLVFDQLGAFGAASRPITLSDWAGVALLVFGVVLIRGR